MKMDIGDVLVLLSIFIVILLFFYSVREYLFYRTKEEKDSTYADEILIGNGQSIGEKDYQNDYFTTVQYNGSLLSVIAGGITDKKDGKIAAIIVVDIFKRNFLNSLHKKTGINIFFQTSIEAISKSLRDNVQGNKIGATLVTVLIEGSVMHFVSVGNCSLIIFRNGELINVNDIHSREAQIGQITLKQNDIALLCSNGVRESLTEREITWHLSKANHPYKKSLNLLKTIQQKRLGHQDNATVVILEKMV